jgi:hypothetical protein
MREIYSNNWVHRPRVVQEALFPNVLDFMCTKYLVDNTILMT